MNIMKKINIFRNKYANLVLLLIFILGSCTDEMNYDVTGDTTNRVYLNDGSKTVNNYNSYVFSVIHTPAGSVGEVKAAFPVRCTQEANTETTATLEIDNSLVDTYNTNNSTDYKKVPDGFAELSTTMLSIAKGGLESADSLIVTIPTAKFSQLTETAYMLPIRISALNTAQNTAISSNMNTIYLIINTTVSNCYDRPGESDMVGEMVADRSAWTATIDVNLWRGPLSNMFNGNTRSYWGVRPPEECNLVVDFGAELTGITGLQIHTYSSSYNLSTIKVYASNDNVNWDSQGTANLATGNSYQYIKFYSPVTTRYIKFDIVGWVSSNYILMTDFNVYTNN